MEKGYTGFLAVVSGGGTIGAWLLEHGLSTACALSGLAASIELFRYTRLKRKRLQRDMETE